MLMLEDLARMSSSEVYSGELSQAWTCGTSSNSSMARRLGVQVPDTDLDPTTARDNARDKFAAVTLNSTRYTLEELSIEIRIRYLNVGYYVC